MNPAELHRVHGTDWAPPQSAQALVVSGRAPAGFPLAQALTRRERFRILKVMKGVGDRVLKVKDGTGETKAILNCQGGVVLMQSRKLWPSVLA